MTMQRPPGRSTRDCLLRRSPSAVRSRRLSDIPQHDDVEGRGLEGQRGSARLAKLDQRAFRQRDALRLAHVGAIASTAQVRPVRPALIASAAIKRGSLQPTTSTRSPA